jgi:hypothetical protein
MSRVGRAGRLLLAAGLALTAGGTLFRAAPAGSTRGFLVPATDLGIYYGNYDQDCPYGIEMTVEAAYLATKTPGERERLLRPENAKEYAKGWKEDFITGPGGENVCNNPKSFLNDPRHPPYRGVQGKISYGMNLDGTTDGRSTATSCTHPKFIGANGESGVDNQLYRAIGCTKYRSPVPQLHPHIYSDPFLIELSGVDDSRNDDHVDVRIYSPQDAAIEGSDGNPLAHQTISATSNARWRAATTGRIVNGQLTTDAIPAMYLHWVLPTWGALGETETEFHDVRFRISMEADGTIKGLMASYRPIDNIFTRGRCCKGTASTANNDCASEHKTLVMMADGYPDSATGQCTMISSAANFSGIPVFIARAHDGVSSRNTN